MAFSGDKYIGDLALYYIAKKLESGQKSGSVKNAVTDNDIDKQLKGATETKTTPVVLPDGTKLYDVGKKTKATKFNQDEISAAQNIADNLLRTGLPETNKKSGFTEKDLFTTAEQILSSKSNIGQNLTPPKAATGEYERKQFQKGLDDAMKASIEITLRGSGEQERNTFLNALGYEDIAEGSGVPFPITDTTGNTGTGDTGTGDTGTGDTGTGDDDFTGDDESGGGQEGGGQEGGGQQGGGQQGGEQQEGNAGDIYDFLNIPEGAYLWDVDGTNYIVYEVPGSNGELYEGNPIFMAYEVQENDIVKAGIYSPEAPALTGAPVSKVFFDKIAIVTGNTDQLSADIDNPFASFVETIGEQALVAPWIKDPEMISLIAEAAVEGRVVTDAEWQVTDWYQEHNETEREWLRTYYSDPSTAAQLTTDAQLAVANSLQASGVSNAPEALINWVAGRYVSGEWSDAYTTEQIALFADPYAQGKRDAQFENYLSSTAISGVDRTTAREREVEELFATWLGPTLGKLTDQEKAEMAGRLRDDPDYKDTLIGSLKQSRLAAFSNYTNPELTYDDIARPWRNLTTSVWGQTADETQGWWQEMVKSNDFATAQTTLREKGLENNITQVTQDATQALTQALGEGLATQGVNQ